MLLESYDVLLLHIYLHAEAGRVVDAWRLWIPKVIPRSEHVIS
ncbi:hypothetical protein AGR7C_Cc150043 [Agrobacterium deltaense Zutra 3/1]|uniref:Uncharacterized protein n=1 Tax=Agrobacterium deltaense Zutra 3/1 TaxID=1183427 RepID=A0A1S7PEL6_9HYPH|nr:hypothetical protein AGR7C_Cc150043 [Agrobacterium deltaense Zutra 3/1]